MLDLAKLIHGPNFFDPETVGDGLLSPEQVARYWAWAREEGAELTLKQAKTDEDHAEEIAALWEDMNSVFEDGNAYLADVRLEDAEPQLSAERYVEAFKQGVILRAFLLLDIQEGRNPPRQPEDIENKLMRSFARCGGYRV